MSRFVTIAVRLHDGRYHGTGDGPPSPFRLFQALVAGAGGGSEFSDQDSAALVWLEQRDSPVIASPVTMVGQRFKTYVPNNDIDAKDGDLRRIGEIRTGKMIRPLLFDAHIPFLYAWGFDNDEESEQHAATICAVAEQLYQFGRGVDLAWAWGEVLDDEELDTRLSTYHGIVYRPSDGGRGRTLACPQSGSMKSLKDRYTANRQRFRTERQGQSTKQIFSQPPKPRFVQVAYESPPSRRVYELRQHSREASFAVWPQARASDLVVGLRDGAVKRLLGALPDPNSQIERVLVGRKADGADSGPTSLRVKIVPLPSIGHHQVDRGIRRVLVEVPAGCPLRADDVHWAFSGLELIDPRTDEVLDFTPSSDDRMLVRYGAAGRTFSRIWRTVTPAALPGRARRRRIDPARIREEAKGGAERAAEQARAAAAVAQALRHAGVRTRAEVIRMQREPFEAKGQRVEAFARAPRFAKERLWHVEITFNAPIAGPLVIGDGRFLGLGVMAPVQRAKGIHAFVVEGGLAARTQPAEVARALRRAVMARAQEVLGARTRLPTFLTGHEPDGSVARTERRPHLTFVFDPRAGRLLIVAPHVVDQRAPTGEEMHHLGTLEAALKDLRELRAGAAGRLIVCATSIDPKEDSLFAASRTWESVTPYQVTRHTKGVGAAEALSADLRTECRRRGLPVPHVTPLEPRGVSGVGLIGGARLTFEVAVEGPIVLGRSRHLGGGLFEGAGP